MREIVQLIVSIFFGLIPLWILILRARNRRQRRQAAAQQASGNASVAQAGGATTAMAQGRELQGGYVRTDSVLGAQSFIPNAYAPLAQGVPAEAGAHDAGLYEEEMDEDEYEDEHSFHLSRASIMRGDVDADADSEPEPGEHEGGTSAVMERRRGALVFPHLTISDLQRAVALSEVLAPPRGLEPYR